MKFVAAGLLIFVLAVSAKFLPNNEEEIQQRAVAQYKVIIVGAGVSGLAAATRLMEKGLNASSILILEASNRIGGRVNTVTYGTGVLDMGAQYVHGVGGNVVYQLAAPAQALDNSTSPYDEDFVFENGTLVSQTKVGTFHDVIDVIDTAADTAFGTYNGSVGRYFSAQLVSNNAQLTNINLELRNALFNHWNRTEMVESGSDGIEQESARGYWEYTECSGNQDIAWKNGYSTVFNLLIGAQPVRTRILYNKTVTNVDRTLADSGILTVACADGTSYTGQKVLMTVSVGVLKAGVKASMFTPALPAVNLVGVQGLEMGVVDKIYLQFDKQWWPSTNDGFNLLKSTVWRTQSDAFWYSDLVGFFVHRKQPNMLLGWVSGAGARKMEALTDTQVITDSVMLLKKYVGKRFNVTNVVKLTRSKWFSDPLFKGSYSFRSMNSETLKAAAWKLGEPVLNSNDKPVLMFAGEATHETHFSTVHGAIETGYREAARIIANP